MAKRRRRPPALAARILAAGVSVSLTIGLVSTFELAAREAAAAAPKKHPVHARPRIVYRYVHVHARPATIVAASAGSPRAATPVARRGPAAPVTHTTRSARPAPRPAATHRSAPRPKPTPTTTSHGS